MVRIDNPPLDPDARAVLARARPSFALVAIAGVGVMRFVPKAPALAAVIVVLVAGVAAIYCHLALAADQIALESAHTAADRPD